MAGFSYGLGQATPLVLRIGDSLRPTQALATSLVVLIEKVADEFRKLRRRDLHI
jgi:hypothetical protein